MKHAYLIMAHNDFYVLEKLIKLLDDKDNDLYIHIDKKVKDFDFEKYKHIIKYSNIYFTKRLDVRWSTNSQINCELLLLEEATQRKYAYYHLLSGVDLPLKNQEEIHSFFQENYNKEFVHFGSFNPIEDDTINRVKYYHFFNKNIRKNTLNMKFHNGILLLQKILKVNRLKKNEKFLYGSNWFSITNELAHYVLKNKKQIKKRYKHTSCADEIFLQTLIYNSKFYKNLYKQNSCFQNMRYIDWERGKPYIFENKDFGELMNCNCLFARKFSSNLDKDIIDNIYERLIK